MKTALAALALALAAPALATEPSPATASKPASAPAVAPGVVDIQTARQLVAQGIKVVDVRTPREYAAGHVPGALNIPYDEIGLRHAEIGPPSTPVMVYCHSGRRSGLAGETLRSKGFTRVYDFKRWDYWVQSEPRR
jgi:rhodanese-related sulfurtransferase